MGASIDVLGVVSARPASSTAGLDGRAREGEGAGSAVTVSAVIGSGRGELKVIRHPAVAVCKFSHGVRFVISAISKCSLRNLGAGVCV